MIRFRTLAAAALITAFATAPAMAQLGRQQGLLDPNLATDAQLTALPGLPGNTALRVWRAYHDEVEDLDGGADAAASQAAEA